MFCLTRRTAGLHDGDGENQRGDEVKDSGDNRLIRKNYKAKVRGGMLLDAVIDSRAQNPHQIYRITRATPLVREALPFIDRARKCSSARVTTEFTMTMHCRMG